ncbi:MAG: PKD domain-containing protein [Bacteroidia bacterium]|nr:PKD domain-containing protein [Bacteroidia bacterium]
MNKTFYSVCMLLLPLFSATAFSQANSVELKDGGGTLISSHASVTAAYGAIPATLTQPYIIEVGSTYTGSSETYPINFVAKTGASAANTITLRPAAGVASVNIQSSLSGNPILQLDNADHVIIDGRAGGTGSSRNLTISNQSTASNANTVSLINGACFNQVKYCNILNATTTNAARGISLGTSASNPSGNSDNRFEHCFFPSGRYRFSTNGTAANLNARNTIYGCIFENIKFVGIWGQAGTGNITIDSCSFYCNSASGDGAFGILFDSQRDTAVIRKCNIYDLQNGSGTALRGIHVRSVISGSNFTDIYNNFISVSTGTTNQTNIAGIEYSGSVPIMARIRYNTIRIGGTLASGGSAGSVGSSAFLKSASTSTSVFDIRNNIFINDRSGGAPQHLAMAITSNNDPLTIDYNVYNSVSGNLVRLGSTVYTTLTAYQAAAAAGTEVNSNDFGVQTVSASDLHLSGTSLGNGNLAATLIAGISTDIDNQVRGSIPYRGADEASPALTAGCNGIPDPGVAVATPSGVCSGGSVSLTLSGLNTLAIPVLAFQWQSSTDGITYANIPAATALTYNTTLTQNTWFRCEVTCTTSGGVDTSVAVQVNITPVPTVTSISETHVIGQYTFTANGVTGASTYLWNFGNGNTSTAVSPTYTYPAVGNYTVTLTVSNSCGSDTTSLNITVGCEGTPDGGTASSSSPSVCAGQSINLSLLGINALIAPTLTFQWQSSPDGITFTNIGGATNTTHTATPTAQTYYRCVVTCTASGLSNTSTVVNIAYNAVPVVTSISETHTGGTYTFTAVGLANASSVSWTFGNGATSNVASPTYTYPIGGTYTVTVIAVNSCGSDTATTILSVGCNGTPAVAVPQPVASSVCMGDNIQIDLTGLDTSDAFFYTYQWQRSADGVTFANLPGATQATLNTIAGTETHYRCIVTCTTSGLSSTSQTTTITIGGTPGGAISETHNGLDYTFSVTGLSGTFTYAWNFGDGNTGTGANPQHTYAANGTYNVSVVVTGNCGTVTLTYTVNPNVGLDNAPEAMGLRLFPNPSDDLVQITSDKLTQADHIRISDISGKACWVQNTPAQFPLTLSVKGMGLSPGMYLVEIVSGTQTASLRLIVR